MDLKPLPWSVKALGRLGTCLRDGTVPSEREPRYGDVVLWYNDLAAAVQERLMGLDFRSILGEVTPVVVSRSKTVDTLTDKLRRDPTLKLPKVYDIAGARLECRMGLRQQDDIVHLVAEHLASDFEVVVKDLRSAPHSGYRAVHLWLRSERLHARAEIQIRTDLRAQWANAFESLADLVGRDIRYGAIPADPKVREVVGKLIDFSLKGISPYEEGLRLYGKLEEDYRRLADRGAASQIDKAELDAMAVEFSQLEQGFRNGLAKRQEALDKLQEGRTR